MEIIFYFKSFPYKAGSAMRSGSQKFYLVKTYEMFGFEGVLRYGIFVHVIVVSILHMFFQPGLDGSTSLANIIFSTRTRNLVDSFWEKGISLVINTSSNCLMVLWGFKMVLILFFKSNLEKQSVMPEIQRRETRPWVWELRGGHLGLGWRTERKDLLIWLRE